MDISNNSSNNRPRRLNLFYRFVNLILKPIIGKNEVIWHTDKPDEPAVYVSNHTKVFAPLAINFCLRPRPRPWVNAYMLSYRNSIRLIYHKIAYDFKPKWLKMILLVLFVPLVNLYFRSLNPIPVYHDVKIKYAFNMTSKTLNSGIDVVIYPEKNIVSPYKYINDLQEGFVHLAQHYYIATGKCVSFYPVYCAQSLRKILIGNPIKYDPDIDIKLQRKSITSYLIKEINNLGDSLPEHKVFLNKFYPDEVNRYNF